MKKHPAPDHLAESKIDSSEVFRGELLHVFRDRVRLPDGGESMREYIVHPGAVMIIPRLPDGKLLLERQYRYPHDRVFIEFPAGKIDPGEAALATAKRELAEETGYTASHWTYFAQLHPIVAYCTEAIEIFIADGLEHVGAALDHGEFLETFSASLEEALQWLDRGEITDSKTMIGLLLLARRSTPIAR